MQTAKQQLIDQAVNHVKITDEVFESFVHHAAYARPFLPPPEATCLDDLMSHAVQLRTRMTTSMKRDRQRRGGMHGSGSRQLKLRQQARHY
jgi:hypothetical protein